ncbi:MAG: molybdopterin-dependent oxidoreductase [Deltaproteobacteria bacterium]|nr:molybdopterin-dependent oxidoreductase [Deltaproteobacteria bacterium]
MREKAIQEERVIMTACSSHCGGRCLLQVHVKDGVITRIETDEGEEPQLRACLRCRAYRQRVYDPNRVKYPMRRKGERGEGKFERISWDEALDETAAQLNRVRSAYGPAAVLFMGSGGDSMHLHNRKAFYELLAMTGGCTTTWAAHSYEGGLFASMVTYGTLSSVSDFDDLLHSRMIIMWGWDPVISVNECNTSWYLIQAKEKGARIISVDPRYTNSASVLAHQWIPIIPGTDAAMLLAIAYVIIQENLQDQAFLDRYTVGFERFRDYLLGVEDGQAKTPSWAAGITGVSAGVIAALAREYATTKPAALVAGCSSGRTAYGEQYHRAAQALSAMTGNVGVHGGWSDRSSAQLVHYGGFDFKVGRLPASSGNPVDKGAPPRRSSLPTQKGSDCSARIHISEFADAILRGKAGGYPADIKMMVVLHTNPVNQYPNTNKIIQALGRLEFIVMAEQVMNSAARYADILLPVSTFMERNDILTGGAVPFYGYARKVIEPLHESRSPLEIYSGLGRRLGITSYEEKTEEEWLREMVKGSYLPDYDELKRKGVYRLPLAESRAAFLDQIRDPERHPFPTPSGKIEIFSQRLADMNDPLLPPIPKYIETWESRNDPLSEKYPLQMITPHFLRRTHSQFETLPWLRELLPQALTMHSSDAASRGIRPGDRVRVFNDRGEVIVPALVTERILPGVVELPQGAWFQPDERGVDRGGCTNVLSRDARSPGGASCYNTCLVQVEKLEEEGPCS